MVRAELTRAAEADLTEIWIYIAHDNLDAADGFVDEINDQFRILSYQPGIGRARPELIDGLRSFPHGNYIILYFPRAYGIEVYRVIHGARDIKAVFFN